MYLSPSIEMKGENDPFEMLCIKRAPLKTILDTPTLLEGISPFRTFVRTGSEATSAVSRGARVSQK